jgi:hypothetical protein
MVRAMRTTITLEADVVARLRQLMRQRGLSFKEAVNFALREGLQPEAQRPPFRTRTFALGPPAVPLDKAMRLAADLDDEETIRKLALRK